MLQIPKAFQGGLYASITGIGYYLGAQIGVKATFTDQGIAILWPPNAVLLAALLLSSWRRWLLLCLAVIPAEIIADLPTFSLTQATLFALVNIVECLIAAGLLNHAVGKPFVLDRLRNVALFGLCAMLLASSLAALLGAAVYVLTTRGDLSYWAFWRIWWFGDGLGLLIVTPVLLVWLNGLIPRFLLKSRNSLEIVLLFTITVLMGGWIFSQPQYLSSHFPASPILLLPLVIWASIRFGISGAAFINLLIAALGIAFTINKRGPFGGSDTAEVTLHLQEYLAALAFSSLALAAVLREIRLQEEELRGAWDQLDRMNQELELRIEERTQALKLANQQLELLASTDVLTGAHNRRYFFSHATVEVKRALRYERLLACLAFDIDHFKHLNDLYGHATGDKALQYFTNTIQANMRSDDLFARFGGEEFVLLLPETGADEAWRVASRLREKVSEILVPDEQGTFIVFTVSIGIAHLNPPHDSLDKLLKRADQALYQAKTEGRNCIRVLTIEQFQANLTG